MKMGADEVDECLSAADDCSPGTASVPLSGSFLPLRVHSSYDQTTWAYLITSSSAIGWSVRRRGRLWHFGALY